MTAKVYAVVVGALISAAAPGAEPNTLTEAERREGFTLLFDGASLAGWDGDPAVWSAAGGAIVGATTAEKPIKSNTFAFWRGGAPADFELRLQWKLEGGNSGVQYRSKDMGNWVAAGYQADMDAGHAYTGILYEERGRGMLALRGEKVLRWPNGNKQVVATVNTDAAVRAAIKKDDWNDYTIIADGIRLIHKLNGVTTMDFIDEEEAKRSASGAIALQVHQGPPMTVRFRSIRLRVLKPAAEKPVPPPEVVAPEAWVPLFDGKSLGAWNVVAGEGFGKAAAVDGRLVLEAGGAMTGILWTQDFPTSNYEVSLEACRLEGQDFFCGLTFPVGSECCTLIVGGWGGGCVGLSNVDRQAADGNLTTKHLRFENGTWYPIRLRVSDARIEVWIDKDKQIDLERAGHGFSIWPQQEPCRPLGVATYYTKAALRNLKTARW
ncbi:MAG TPA: DUF1080 domain-containing protein [Planctomycetota bacterium]|nr:DUF1080 domain-containing protein [Planctomycetota bacterium]OQC21641.1 MAG: hypothetical protein BWX69_00855 [Planctomycetes bacterium ADurb.Bin069]HNS00397.1 DUF1080 domain-containing protein [Planctomycetota bacterium]HNU26187.1 DUF1080 domain-containing protein [Planctomycetota bacterium]HOE28717.1 DUF1080 domain-containing protein [Planctomycetota bacterium]